MPSSYAFNKVRIKKQIQISLVSYCLHLHSITATKTPSFIASPSVTAIASAFPSATRQVLIVAAEAGQFVLRSTLANVVRPLPLNFVELLLVVASSVPAAAPTGLGRAAAPLLIAAIQLALRSLSF